MPSKACLALRLQKVYASFYGGSCLYAVSLLSDAWQLLAVACHGDYKKTRTCSSVYLYTSNQLSFLNYLLRSLDLGTIRFRATAPQQFWLQSTPSDLSDRHSGGRRAPPSTIFPKELK